MVESCLVVVDGLRTSTTRNTTSRHGRQDHARLSFGGRPTINVPIITLLFDVALGFRDKHRATRARVLVMRQGQIVTLEIVQCRIERQDAQKCGRVQNRNAA
jgi:hypothetical protein